MVADKNTQISVLTTTVCDIVPGGQHSIFDTPYRYDQDIMPKTPY